MASHHILRLVFHHEFIGCMTVHNVGGGKRFGWTAGRGTGSGQKNGDRSEFSWNTSNIFIFGKLILYGNQIQNNVTMCYFPETYCMRIGIVCVVLNHCSGTLKEPQRVPGTVPALLLESVKSIDVPRIFSHLWASFLKLWLLYLLGY